MTTSNGSSKTAWVDPDDAPEWTDEMFDHAEFSIGDTVIRPATGVLTRDGVRPVGRPRGSAKSQIALRIDNDVLAAFRAQGPGWQSRMNAVLRKAAGV
jgi:uncharacterized protein (DUF4415 family)